MNIFLRELSRNKKSLIIWTLSMVIFSIFLMAFFPTIQDQAAELDELMKQYPKDLVAAFNLDRLSMSDPMGYYGGQTYLFITLFGSIYAMLLFSGVLSREESEHTSEFLMTRPVKRNRIITAKTLAAFTMITVFNVVFGIANKLLFDIYAKDGYDGKTLFLLILGPWLMHLFFGALGLLMSIFIVKARAVYPAAIGVVLGAYFISILASLTDSAEFLRYFSPFKYVDAADIVYDRMISGTSLAIMAATCAVSLFLSYFFYNRKDFSA